MMRFAILVALIVVASASAAAPKLAMPPWPSTPGTLIPGTCYGKPGVIEAWVFHNPKTGQYGVVQRCAQLPTRSHKAVAKAKPKGYKA